MICNKSCSVYSNTMKMHLSSRMISSSCTTFACDSSVHNAISRMADCDRPVYWIDSPSLSGLNLRNQMVSRVHAGTGKAILLNRKLSLLSIFADGLVHPAVGSAADEPNDVIAVSYANFAGIARSGGSSRIDGFYNGEAVSLCTSWRSENQATGGKCKR